MLLLSDWKALRLTFKLARTLGLLIAVPSLFHLQAQSAAVPSAVVATPAEIAQKTLMRNCYGCHNEKLKSGSLSFHDLKAATVPADAATWEKILRKVRAGEMPPVGAPPIAPEAAATFTGYVEAKLDGSAKASPNPGTPSIHRLNRSEYSNAVRDILALDLDHSASLPTDDSGYGFDNIGAVLTVSPLLMEKYMSASRRVARIAMGSVKAAPAIEKYPADKGRESLSTEVLPISVRGGMAINRYFPLNAEYTILARVRGTPDPSLPAPMLDLRIDGVRSKLLEAAVDPAEENQHTRNFEIRLPLKAGMHEIGAAFLTELPKGETGVVPARRGGGGPPPALGVSIDHLLVGGPFNAQGVDETPSRKRIFACRPAHGEPEEICARKILTPIATQAYRRPVEATEIDPLLSIFAAGRKDGGSFDAGIEMALRAVLVSPNFLFRVERSPAGAQPDSIHPVTELELASRLSFFLWSSIPDEELIRVATEGHLRQNLEPQVRRMLADPKANAIVENFAGQWLHLRNITSWNPDPDKYPQFDESLRSAFQKETELFFRHIIRQDRSILDFINADYSFLNERLARHYGVANVKGNYFRRVALPSAERGGILSQGSILTVTSYPTRTSPVLRGKWILENVLGSPPPPPPPDIPDLEDSATVSAKDLRAALEKHRSKAACASCHSRLDPLGFSLENYDAIGRFRKAEGGATIDSSGSMPNGMLVDGPTGLKKVLMSRQDEFVDCLAEKYLTYALGRGLEYYDLPAVREIRRQAAKNDSKFSALTLAVVNSVPFQMRRTEVK